MTSRWKTSLLQHLQRIRASVERGTPFMAQRILEWMGSLYPDHSLQEYWTDPDAFPLLLDAVVAGKNATPKH